MSRMLGRYALAFCQECTRADHRALVCVALESEKIAEISFSSRSGPRCT